MKYFSMQRWLMAAAFLVASLATAPGYAQQGEAGSLEELIEQTRSGQSGDQGQFKQAMQEFRGSSSEAQQKMLEQARSKFEKLEAKSAELAATARENEAAFKASIQELQQKLGDAADLFPILRQYSSDLIGLFRNSLTSIQFSGRQEWLEEFIKRMKKSSEVFTIAEIERMWSMMQEEIAASGNIVQLKAPVLRRGGGTVEQPIVRIGNFNLVTEEPEPLYLNWQAENERISVLPRQPGGGFLGMIADFVGSDEGVYPVGIDPTGGSLLSRLVAAPSLTDRINQGGRIGYLTLLMGLIGLLVAIYKLVDLFLIGSRVERQRRRIDQPRNDNPLGRLLRIFEDNRGIDTDTLEMRLGEGVLKERPRIDRFVRVLGVIAVLAPLMGLLGTVIGMIQTFQAITLFGAGDASTMAAGISKALMTTVLGLTVAIPMTLLHALVQSRANAVVNTLKHQTAGLIAERMEEHSPGMPHGPPQMSPSPA